MNYTFQFGDVLRYWPLLLEGALNTLLYSAAGMLLGLLIGVIGAVWRNSRYVPLRAIAALYVEVVRNTPLLVQLFVAFFVLPSIGISLSASQAAVLALVFNNGAYMTEIIRAGIENINRSQREAAASLGLTRWQAFRWVIILQALDWVYPAMISQFVLMMLSSSIISAIGADELTAFGSRIQSDTFRPLEVYVLCAVIYLALTFLVRGVFEAAAIALFPRRRRLKRT